MTWVEAHRAGYDVEVRDPGFLGSAGAGVPRSLEVLEPMLDGGAPSSFSYFSVHECEVAGEPFLVSAYRLDGASSDSSSTPVRPDVDGARVFPAPVCRPDPPAAFG